MEKWQCCISGRVGGKYRKLNQATRVGQAEIGEGDSRAGVSWPCGPGEDVCTARGVSWSRRRQPRSSRGIRFWAGPGERNGGNDGWNEMEEKDG